jgi:signal peptidase I
VLPGSARWLLLLLPYAFLISFVHDNWLLRVAGFRMFTIPSTGMESTVIKGERIVADLRRYRNQKPISGDVIVISKGSDHYLKRVIATEGNSIRGERGSIFVDDRLLDEPYVQHIGGAPAELADFGPQTVPHSNLFVMGDNRDVSRDSRLPDFGLVDESEVEGKALYLISLNRRRLGKDLQ